MRRRVVITGLGIVSPNAITLPAFTEALQNGVSGVQFVPEFQQLKYNCQVTGRPDFNWEELREYIPEVTYHGLKGIGIGYGIRAAIDAWTDAGHPVETDEPRWETGCIFGTSTADSDIYRTVVSRVEALEVKKLGSRVVEQVMISGVPAYISGRLGLAGRVMANSAACATGSQSVLTGYEYIRNGMAKRMLVGSTEYVDTYMFGAFDAMRVLSRKFNQDPTRASRPMSQTAGGFIPASGAGALVLEDLEFAQARGARIYAEIKGGAANSGGQRGGGSMTSPNPEGVIRCIRQAMEEGAVGPGEIDLVMGHLTATGGDVMEIENWSLALGRKGANFPLVNSLKSMIGHCLSAAGSIESVAAALQIFHQFVHPNINLEDPNPEITKKIDVTQMPTHCLRTQVNTIAKANFGFGDVNTCLIFSKYK